MKVIIYQEDDAPIILEHVRGEDILGEGNDITFENMFQGREDVNVEDVIRIEITRDE